MRDSCRTVFSWNLSLKEYFPARISLWEKSICGMISCAWEEKLTGASSQKQSCTPLHSSTCRSTFKTLILQKVEIHLCTAWASPISLSTMSFLLLAGDHLLLAGDCHLVPRGQRPVARGKLLCETRARLHPRTMLLLVFTAALSSLLVGGYND